MAKVLGIVDIVWKGANIPVEKGAKIRLSGIKNNVVTYGRRAGAAGEFMAGEVMATTHLERGQRASEIFSTEPGELQVICDTGQTFAMPDAFMTDIPELSGGEGGKAELKWAFGEYEEILN